MADDPSVQWIKVEQSADSLPSKRSGHTLTSLGNTAFLFGGIDLKNPPGPNNDLYAVDMAMKGACLSLCLSLSLVPPR